MGYDTIRELTKKQIVSEITVLRRLKKLTRVGIVKSIGNRLLERKWSFREQGRLYYETYMQYSPNHYSRLSIRETILLLELPNDTSFQLKDLLIPEIAWQKLVLRMSLEILHKYLLLEKSGQQYRRTVYTLTEEGKAVKVFLQKIYHQWESNLVPESKFTLSPTYYNWMTTHGLYQLAVLTTLLTDESPLRMTSELGPLIGIEPNIVNDQLWELFLNKFAKVQQKGRSNLTIMITATGELFRESMKKVLQSHEEK